MKQTLCSVLVFIAITSTSAVSCKKDKSCERCNINTINKPPVACAGNDQTIILPVNNVLLDGSCSDDPENNINGYLWTKISGPSSFQIKFVDSPTTVVDMLVLGIYEFELKLTDDNGAITKDTVQIIVTANSISNQRPVACAGDDMKITLPINGALLNGKCSTDPNNNISSFLWTKVSGPSSYIIKTAHSLVTEVVNLQEGIYQFELTVSDKDGLTGKDTVSVDVQKPVVPHSNELIFKDLIWIFPWYSAIEVENINQYGSPKKVFVQRDFDSTWVEVSYLSDTSRNILYEYFIETRPLGAGMYNYGSLYIFYYGADTNDTPAVKITF